MKLSRDASVVLLVLVTGCGLVPGGGGLAQRRAKIVSCPTTPAPKVFSQALCLCGDYRAVGKGLWVKGASAGVNGRVEVVGQHTFESDLVSYGGVTGVGTLSVGGDLTSAGAVEGVGQLTVGGDLSASALSGVGAVKVAGTLRCGGEVQSVGSLSSGARGPYTTPAGPPCACDAAQRLDVAAEIARLREKNDDAAIGLAPALKSVGDLTLALGSGQYYLSSFDTVGNTTLTVDGAVALAVDGALEAVGTLRFALTRGSTLDLYLKDGLQGVGDSLFGEGSDPGSVRLYVAGDKALQLVGQQKVVGAIYAPQADLELVGDTSLEGGLFARDVDGVGQLEVKFAAPVVLGPDSPQCQPTPILR